MAFDEEQRRNAATITQVGRQMGASQRDIQIALMTALQESGLRNVNHGDRDSLGLFQQRPSQGWGSAAQVRDPTHASKKFFTGLLGLGGREDMPLWQAAAKVQRPAKKFEKYYQKHEFAANELLADLGGEAPRVAPAAGVDPLAEAAPVLTQDPAAAPSSPLGIAAPTAIGAQSADVASQAPATEVADAVEAAAFLPSMTKDTYLPVAANGATGRAGELITKAKGFLGTPYVWGGAGPNGFDCSGFTSFVYKQFGVALPRISAEQAKAGPRVSLDDLKPGDMVAWDNSSRNNGADHIAIYVGNGQVIHAPRPGDKVRISPLWDQGRAWGVRMNL